MNVTLSGKIGSGKSTVAEELAKIMNLERHYAGGIIRNLAGGIPLQKFYEQAGKDLDFKIDEEQKRLGAENDNLLLEGRVAFYVVPDSMKIFFDVSDEEGARRVYNDQERKEAGNETNFKTQEEALAGNKKRTQTEKKRYQELYGIDHHNPDNFDLIVDTTNKSIEEVTKLVQMKMVDYQIKMKEVNFYLAHPTESKDEVRRWEFGFERRTEINLLNPFKDFNLLETELGDPGKEKYSSLTEEQKKELFRIDLNELSKEKVIGGIFLFDDSYTIGTPVEMIVNRLMGKLTYSVWDHPQYPHGHPIISLLSDKNFSKRKDLEQFLVKNKNHLFKFLEQSRTQTLAEPYYKNVFEQISRNHKYQNIK